MPQQIFAIDPQNAFDLGEPRQDGIEFPDSLVERYQPRRIEDFIGLKRPKETFTKLLKQPRAISLLLIGPPGAGKTVMPLAFAEQLPGSLYHVPAQKCDVAMLDDLTEKFSYPPQRGKFWICLIDEADQMTDKAQLQMLSRLDSTASLKQNFGGAVERGKQPPIIWINTCNGLGPGQINPPASLLPRFRSRNLIVPFPAVTVAELAPYLETIWTREGGDPQPREWFEFMAKGEGVRDALMRLESDLLAGPRPIEEPEPEPAPKSATVIVMPRDGEMSVGRQAALKAWETRRARARMRGHR